MTMIDIDALRLDGGTQPRAYLDATTVEDYAERMEAGDQFPPIIVFYDGTDYWPGDGFHRAHAAKALGLAEIDADVRQGTQRDAILFSCSANAVHGMRRTNEDKQRAVKRLLTDDEWVRWSDRKIAEHCCVSDYMVRNWRAQLYPAPSPSAISSQTRTVHRGGTTYEMNTGGINAGRGRPEGTNEAGYAAGSAVGVTSSYQPTPEIPARPVGYRERDVRNPALQIEGTLLAIRNAMGALPSATVAAAAVPHFNMDEAERFSMWWTDFSEELRERAERAA